MPTAAVTRRILLADDDPQIRQILHRKLSAQHADVVECADGKQALQALRSEKFDAILLDLKMPNADGYAVLDEVRQTINADTPLYVLTSLPNDIATERAREHGAKHILSKHEFSAQKVAEFVCNELPGADRSGA